jgi:hypothetical protein
VLDRVRPGEVANDRGGVLVLVDRLAIGSRHSVHPFRPA